MRSLLHCGPGWDDAGRKHNYRAVGARTEPLSLNVLEARGGAQGQRSPQGGGAGSRGRAGQGVEDSVRKKSGDCCAGPYGCAS